MNRRLVLHRLDRISEILGIAPEPPPGMPPPAQLDGTDEDGTARIFALDAMTERAISYREVGPDPAPAE